MTEASEKTPVGSALFSDPESLTANLSQEDEAVLTGGGYYNPHYPPKGGHYGGGYGKKGKGYGDS